MNEEQGLASRAGRQPTLQEVIQAILQGIKPEELLQAGVPEEMIEAAMQEIMEQNEPQVEDSGLANTAVRSNDQIQPVPSR